MPQLTKEDMEKFAKEMRIQKNIERDHFIQMLAIAVVDELERRRDK